MLIKSGLEFFWREYKIGILNGRGIFVEMLLKDGKECKECSLDAVWRWNFQIEQAE